MQFLLVAFGTYGDVHPFLALGSALRRQGYAVTLASLDVYRRQAEAIGLNFIHLHEDRVFHSFIHRKESWDPRGNLKTLLNDFITPFLEPVYELVMQEQTRKDTCIICSPLCIGARIAYDRQPFTFVTANPYPFLFLSTAIPPSQARVPLRPLSTNPLQSILFSCADHLHGLKPGTDARSTRIVVSRKAPGLLRAGYKKATVYLLDLCLGEQINALRRRVGLPRITGVFDSWLFSPELVLGLFPDWFAPRACDWPPQVELVGFPDPGDLRPAPSPQLVEFLQSGPAPIVFTFGTEKPHNADQFHAAFEACRIINQRAVFVTRHDAFPDSIPAEFLHVPYEPFPYLFERSSLVVHHAGIGTSADALRAGVPQLLLPFHYDQPDNTSRLLRLGVGRTISPSALTAANLADTMHELVTSPDIRRQCALCAEHFTGQPLGQDVAAAVLLDRLVAS